MAFSLAENYIIVNYHYIQDPVPEWRGIHPCAVAEFTRQMAFLRTYFSFVSVSELVRAAEDGRPGKFCALTFDDGLRSQFMYAVPILRANRAAATFFVITAALERRLPLAHKIHTVLSKIPVGEVIVLFNDFVRTGGFGERRIDPIPTDRFINTRRKYDDMQTANFKETMVAISEEDSQAFLVRVMRRHSIHEEETAQRFFMDEEQVRYLADEGFAVENHTHTHASFEGLSDRELWDNLMIAQARLNKVVGRPATVIAYPYGRRGSATSAELAGAGFCFGVSVEPRGIGGSEDHFSLPRYDTNDIKRFLDEVL